MWVLLVVTAVADLVPTRVRQDQILGQHITVDAVVILAVPVHPEPVVAVERLPWLQLVTRQAFLL